MNQTESNITNRLLDWFMLAEIKSVRASTRCQGAAGACDTIREVALVRKRSFLICSAEAAMYVVSSNLLAEHSVE